ncbi:MAG TPA: TonB-dependent receptor [Candidatus Sulfotelmatobacter sp.]|nr:TonB-dependent receptor [Candidatus Sulfotelmatobacter sp.]
MRARIFFLVFVLLAAVSLSAQTFRGTILGTVTDPSGAVVSDAKVTVKNTGTGLERSTTTSGDGSYSVTELPIGTYTVTITQSGFQTFRANGVTVDVATERRVDAALKTGEVSTQVEVSADQLPLVETTMNTLGGMLTAETVENMPVNGRDYTKLIYMNPGVSGSPDQISDSPGSFGEFSMNGARGRSNNYLLDGTDMNDGYRNDPAINEAGVFGTPSTILPIDAVAEVNVLSNFEPEYGRSAGAIVNIVTKSGTNSIHGSAADYFRNNALDARNYFNPSSQPKAPFHNNQYGGSIGGPIVKDKTFFYLDYEGQQEPVGVVTVASVPTGTAADGSLQPSDSSNPVIQQLIAKHPWPAPNLSRGTPDFTMGTASVISPSFNRLTSFIAKIDQNFNASNILTGRYFFGDSIQSFPLALTASGGQLPGFNTFTPTRVQLVSLSYTHTFGANKVNELRYGWNRFAEGFFPADEAFHPSSVGLCAATDPTLCNGSAPFDSGLPIMLVGDSTSGHAAQLGATSSLPRHRFDSNNQVLDNFSWKMNKHDVKVGVDFHRTSIQQYFDKYFRGRLSFDGSTTGAGGLQDFLAGAVDGGFQYYGNSVRHTHENNFGFYVQDSFRATPHLTINYGLRWDYFGVVKEKNNLLSNITNFDLANDTFTLTQVGQAGLSSLYNPDKKDFAPRVSASWDVTGKGKTVIRAGFGMFFDAFSQDMALGHLPYSPYFDPGPAYNPLPSAQPIYSTGAIGGTIVAGSPVFAAAAGCNYECDAFAFDRNIKTPYMENYNLNIQQQLSSHSVLQLSYVGSQGHRLWRFFDVSQPSQAQITAADCPNGIATCATTGAITGDYGVSRNYGGNPYGAFYILQENSTGKSNYNAFQASYRINGWHGVTSILNYVYSKSLDNSSDGEDFEPNAAQPNDSTNPQLEYAPSNFNLPHRLTWNFAYEFPKAGGNWQKLKNGWGLNSILTLQSGQPFQFNYNFEGDYSGSGNGFDRPDVVGPIKYNPRDPVNFVDLSAFAMPCTILPGLTTATITGTSADCVPGTRHFGNERRNSLHGPSFKEWNFALYKTTNLTERLTMQLRADFFNILNHPNFANPFLPAFLADPAIRGFQVTNGSETGVPGTAGSTPIISATGDVGIGNPFIGGGGPRGIQLAAVFRF